LHGIQLRFIRLDNWPPLAWLAHCRSGASVVDVIHGSRVENTHEWFCEAGWDGAYEDGDFDRTDLVFGSGGRVRNGLLTFVSSGTTVDRLQVIESAENVWVSNSLPCLLAVSAGSLDPLYRHYSRDFRSICRGLLRYVPMLATSAGSARLIYFNNLSWDGKRLAQTVKPSPRRDFGTFAAYRAFLEQSLQHIATNVAAPARRHPFRFLGTISSGYDSPTVAALARSAGLREVISFDQCNAEEPDSGLEIARQLGLQATVIPRDSWRGSELAEVPFLAADAKGEDVYFKSAEPLLAGTALLTGFHGDKMWGKYTSALSPDIRRGDQSGLSLTEYRLRAGFLHCPVPFMGVRQIHDINRLSRSAALSRWDVDGDYTRPICRRIVEEAGVSRKLFGMRKKAASVLFSSSTFLTPAALAEFVQWLESQGLPVRLGRRSVWKGVAHVSRTAASVVGSFTGIGAIVARAGRHFAEWAERDPMFRWVFPWATERARSAYAPA
jgi:hypothetical protein